MMYQNHYEAVTRDNLSASNVAYRVDPMRAEQYIRSHAQKEFAKAVARSFRVGMRNVWKVLSDASDLKKKHGTNLYNGI